MLKLHCVSFIESSLLSPVETCLYYYFCNVSVSWGRHEVQKWCLQSLFKTWVVVTDTRCQIDDLRPPCQHWLTGCHMSNVYMVRFMTWFMAIWPLCHPDCHVTPGPVTPDWHDSRVCKSKDKTDVDLTFDGFMMFLSLTCAKGFLWSSFLTCC